MSGRRRHTGNKNPQVSMEPGNKIAKSRACPDIHRDLIDLTSQMQMISAALTASREISKHRPFRKVHDIAIKTNVQPRPELETSIEIPLEKEEKLLQHQSNRERKNVIISYMMRENRDVKLFEKSQGFESRDETSAKSDSDDEWEKCRSETSCQRFGSASSSRMDFQNIPNRSSKVGLYQYEEVHPERMIEVIQRELKILMEKVPSVAVVVAALSDSIFHCKVCFRCREKISYSLPWILNRIQKLIKYITTKRQETYCWPNDYSYLRLVPSEPIIKCLKEQKNGSEYGELKSELPPEEPTKQTERLEKVDATVVAEGRPGIQIHLEVQSEKRKKRSFDQGQKILGVFCANFPVVELKEPESASVIQVLKPQPTPRIFWTEKQEQFSPKEFSHSFHQVFLLPLRVTTVFLELVPVVQLDRFYQAEQTLSADSEETLEKAALQPRDFNPVLLLHTQDQNKANATRQDPKGHYSNVGKLFTPRNILANAPEIVQDLLKEAEEERMQLQKVKELKSEVKSLKDLMIEAHKNQMDLSKVLLEKGVFSKPIIKLTDPSMLEEESQAVKKAEEIEGLETRSSSVEALQTTVEKLKRKCILKNKMLLTLLKGLKSNVPKERWEEMVNSVFDDSEPTEEISSEKVGEFLRQASTCFMNSEKASSVSLPVSRTEEQLLEDFDGFLDCQYPVRIFAFPATNVPDTMNTSIKKLENQISILNGENERLWHEVNELRDLLKGSIKEYNDKRISHPLSERRTSDTFKTSAKTINLTIQIASDKDFHHSKDTGFLKVTKLGETCSENAFADASKSSPSVKSPPIESSSNVKEINCKEFGQNHKLTFLDVESKFCSKAELPRLENDLNNLDDSTARASDHRQEKDKINALLQERAFGKASEQKIIMATPHPSGHDFLQNLKPVVRVPSKYVISEASDSYQAGPSRKEVDIGHHLQNLSSMKLAENQSHGITAAMANERELHPILENDQITSSPSSSTSRIVSQVIQRLRARVRSIHKDVAVLKSKNDRIDKMLDKLMDDAVDNNLSFEEVENQLKNFKNQLG